jgi:hypothetical protein
MTSGLGYLYDLIEALHSPELEQFDTTPTPAADKAAARLAIALGYCRIFGIDAGEYDGTLPVPEALGAIRGLRERMKLLKEDIKTLPERWDSAADSIEAQSYCADILEERMNYYAAQVVLGEALLSAVFDDDINAEQLDKELAVFMSEVADIDELFTKKEILFFLSTLVGTALINNWRNHLVAPYNEYLPYWLDGTLEEVAKILEEETKKTLVQVKSSKKEKDGE